MLDAVRWKSLNDNNELLPGKLRLIDQTRLPGELQYLETDDADEIHDAIRRLVVRGAPAIGCAAALGLAAVIQHSQASDNDDFIDELERTADYLATSRPTAYNLFWALSRCKKHIYSVLENKKSLTVWDLKLELIREAMQILEEDIELCKSIGRHGFQILQELDAPSVLTHCNAGALATSDYGTALSPVYVAHEKGLNPRVYAGETRPLLQGARLTTWELQKAGVPVTLICDNMAAEVMREGTVDCIIVGADRIAANGDTANKIGTYSLAINAHYHRLPFYVAAPYSTIDFSLKTGAEIPIEQRSVEELTEFNGRRIAPDACQVYNPAFDVTPAELITGIITERGIMKPPFEQSMSGLQYG